MSICKKCDRCGKRYDKYNKEYSSNERNMNGIASVCVSTNGNNYMDCEIYDLCPNCLKSFKNWWNEINITLSDDCVKKFEEDCEDDLEEEVRTDTTMDRPDELIIHEPDGNIKRNWGEDDG